MWQPQGLTTGIGSLPHTDPEPAIRLVMDTLPAAPHWPQMPKRGEIEGFVLQFLNPLVKTGLLVERGDKVQFATDAPDWADRLAAFYELFLAVEAGDEGALDAFAIPREAAAGFWAFVEECRRLGSLPYAKGQVVGPLTVGFRLTDASGRPAYYDDQIRDAIVKNLAMQARWQAAQLSALADRAIVFIDEPGVSIYGQSTYITVTREMIVEDLGAVVAGIQSAGALAGIHSCAAVDWGLLYQAGPEIVSFDAYEYFASLAPFRSETAAFLAAGGVLAWGIVPTSDKSMGETGKSLAERLRRYFAEAIGWGIPGDVLARQALLTPACGTGTLNLALAEHIYGLLAAVGALFKEND